MHSFFAILLPGDFIAFFIIPVVAGFSPRSGSSEMQGYANSSGRAEALFNYPNIRSRCAGL
jgi:hypothetical protein